MQAVVSSSSTLSLISSCRSTLKSPISTSFTRVLQQSPPPSISYWTWQKNKISHRGFLSSWLSTTNYHGTSYHHHHRIMYMCSFRGINMSSSNRGGCRTEEEGKEKGEIIYHAKRIQEPDPMNKTTSELATQATLSWLHKHRCIRLNSAKPQVFRNSLKFSMLGVLEEALHFF